MSSTLRRVLPFVVGIVILGVAFFFSSYLASQKKAPPRQPSVVRTKQVAVQQVANGTVATTLEVQGRLAAYDKVDLYSEVGGPLKSTGASFKVGTYFAKGAPIIRLDDEEARLALLAQKSTLLNTIAQLMPDLKIDYPDSYPQWERYLNDFKLEGALPALPNPVNNREKLYVAARNVYTQYYNIKSAEERLSKYTIYAPFGGVLTEANINPGAVVRTGQKLGALMRTGNYELVATVPLADLGYIQVGNTVKLGSDDVAGQWTGQVKRISDQIDPGSQTVQVFIAVAGEGLREGMYLRGAVNARSIDGAFRINRSLLVNQNNVYEVQDSVLRLLPVEVVKVERESAIVRGLPNGTVLLRDMPPGAFEGMKVKIAQ